MDGGACSRDAFRMPSAGEELTTPFSGFVVRYGHSARLAKSTAAIAGLAAELPPRMEEPYRVIYFVVTDQTRTTIATLRAVLKEGLSHPSPLPKALVIDELHTLEVFRKQGLATSLTNFVKGIAEAHEIGLYARCGVYTRTFWELRGFQEETIPEVLRACGRDGEDDMIMAPAATLMRAGPAYTEYQPANGERLSIIRPFYHSQCGVVYLDPSTGSSLAAGSELSLAGGSRFLHQGSAECGGVGSFDDHGDGVSGASPAASSAAAAAVAAAAGATQDSATCAEGGGGCGAGGTVLPPSRVLTNERLARHDEEEEAKCPRPSVPWDTLARTETVADMILSDDKGTAAAKAALAQRNLAGGWPGVGAASGVGLLPPPPPPPPPPQSFVGSGGETGGPAAAAAVAATSGVTSTVAGFLGYRPSEHQIGAATAGPWDSAWSGAAGGAADGDRRALAAKGLLAIPTSGYGTDVVDLTGSKSLDEQDEEQMQLAIAMSLSAVEAGTNGGGGGGIDKSSDGGVSSGAVCGGGEASADDTETEEDVDSSAQLSGEDAREPGEAATTAAAAAALPSTSRFAPAGSGRGRQSGSSGGHTSSGTGSGSDRCASDGVREGHGGQGGKGSVEARHREDGHGRDGADGDGDNSLRRIRRRRDESGASTPGEQSPGGVDGGGGAAEGTVGTGLDDAAPAASARGEGGGGGGDGAGGDPGGDGSAQVGIAPATSGLGSDALAATAVATTTTTTTTTATTKGGSKSPCSSRPSPQPCPDAAASPSPSTSSSSFSFSLEPRPRDNQAAAAAVGVRAGQVVLGQRDLNSAMVVCSQQEQRQQQEQRSSGDKDGSSMDTGAPGGGVYPSVPSAAPAAAAAPGGAPDFGVLGEGAAGTVQGVGGGVGAGGGGFVSDDIEASDIMMRDFGVGADVLDGGGGGGGGGDVGRLDDKLITVAGWQGEDNDEELRRVMEASMHSHEQEMLQRATQESQEAAAAAAEAASIATAPTAASMHLPHPPQSAPYALTTLGSGGGGGGDGPGGGGAFNPRGGGPDAAVLPDFGSREPAGNGAIGHGDGRGANEGTAFPGTGGGAGAAGFQARSGGGAAGSSAEAAAAAAAAAVAAWADRYDDGEVLPFAGKGKGKSRRRD